MTDFGDLPEEMEGELDEEEDPEALKAKLAELDAEAEKLKKDASKMEEEIKGDKAGAVGSKEEADARSVYVGNVRDTRLPPVHMPRSRSRARACGRRRRSPRARRRRDPARLTPPPTRFRRARRSTTARSPRSSRCTSRAAASSTA